MIRDRANNPLRERIIETIKTKPQGTHALAQTLGQPFRTVAATLQHMRRDGLVRPATDDRLTVWEVVPTYEAAAPRTYTGVNNPPFTGVDWSHSTSRPGCLDYAKYPSRIGDKRVPHTGNQIHMTGRTA
jgi:hypothetical protein